MSNILTKPLEKTLILNRSGDPSYPTYTQKTAQPSHYNPTTDQRSCYQLYDGHMLPTAHRQQCKRFHYPRRPPPIASQKHQVTVHLWCIQESDGAHLYRDRIHSTGEVPAKITWIILYPQPMQLLINKLHSQLGSQYSNICTKQGYIDFIHGDSKWVFLSVCCSINPALSWTTI